MVCTSNPFVSVDPRFRAQPLVARRDLIGSSTTPIMRLFIGDFAPQPAPTPQPKNALRPHGKFCGNPCRPICVAFKACCSKPLISYLQQNRVLSLHPCFL